ncbi:hypothetical protein PS1_006137 [Malus domestica]
MAEIQSLKEEIRGLKHENKQLHKLAHSYATNMKRKIDQLQETDGHILLDHRRFVGLFQQHLPSSSGAAARNEAPTDQPLIPPPSVAHRLLRLRQLLQLRRLLRPLPSSLCEGSSSCIMLCFFISQIPVHFMKFNVKNPLHIC